MQYYIRLSLVVSLALCLAGVYGYGCAAGQISVSGIEAEGPSLPLGGDEPLGDEPVGDAPAAEEALDVTMKLVRMDGTELDLASRPIPLVVTLKMILPPEMAAALSDVSKASPSNGIEDAISIYGDDGLVEGAFTWQDDITVLFKPAHMLNYHSVYSVVIDLPQNGETEVVERMFTTMTKGDINGDGYADYVLGHPGFDYSRGRVMIFYGSENGPSPLADAVIHGKVERGKLGSVNSRGDLNGDGYADLLMSAMGANVSRGVVYGFYGKAEALSGVHSVDEAAFTWSANEEYGQFGSTIVTTDINGDGILDIAVAAFSADGILGVDVGWPPVSVLHYGHVYVRLGSLATPASCSFPDCPWDGVIKGGSDNFHWLGISMAAGDVNGDRYGDLVVGAHGFNGQRGQVYVFYGGEDPDLDHNYPAVGEWNPSVTLDGINGGDRFGMGIAVGDVGGDNLADIAVGADLYDAGANKNGAVFVFNGGAEMPSTIAAGEANSIITGKPMNWNNFGLSPVVCDIDGDGFGNIGSGSSGEQSAGRISFFKGSALVPTMSEDQANVWLNGEYAGANLRNVGGCLDYNGDGIYDVAMDAHSWTGSGKQGYGLVQYYNENNWIDAASSYELIYRYQDDAYIGCGKGARRLFAGSLTIGGELDREKALATYYGEVPGYATSYARLTGAGCDASCKNNTDAACQLCVWEYDPDYWCQGGDEL